MKTLRSDMEQLQHLSPSNVAAYLRARRWSFEEEYLNRESFWTLRSDSDEEQELLLPLKPEFRDFGLRMGEVLETLAKTEGRSEIEILRDLLTATMDVVKLKVDNSDPEDGSITLENGVELFQSARKMLASVARATVEPRAQFLAGMPSKVSDYLSKVRVGQTERGSYVINILSPVPVSEQKPDDSSGQLFSARQYDDPFARSVMKMLLSALESTRSAAKESEKDPHLGSFRSSVSLGVSANLCDALVKISESGGNKGLDVDLRWAFTFPESDENRHTVSFDSSIMPTIEEAARMLRATSPYENYAIEGYIIKLQREQLLDDGQITILAFVDEQIRQVSVRLERPDYSKAVLAHDQGDRVLVYGRLERRGKRYFLDRPRELSVVADQEVMDAN